MFVVRAATPLVYGYEVDDAKLAKSLESSEQLLRYTREHHVEQIYSCWSGDEEKPQEFERRISVDALVKRGFFFREKELLMVDSEKQD